VKLVRVRQVFSLLASLTSLIALLSLCALVLALAWQVFGRYVLNASPSWTEPVALTLMSVVALFGAALGVRKETHFNFPTLAHSTPPPVRAALKALSRLIAMAFGLALAAFGGVLMRDGWDVPMAGAPLPEGAAYAGIALGGVLIALFAFERLTLGGAAEEHG
jgi:TRAP-type C4-dicarboxylate transport system permease small subunit